MDSKSVQSRWALRKDGLVECLWIFTCVVGDRWTVLVRYWQGQFGRRVKGAEVHRGRGGVGGRIYGLTTELR